ncbi:hypothetical protein [Dongia sp.]|uniref:hypothetical protein n=1 Tax=Dongia sp. TaxID=1977262 RepID=UPI003752BEB7
MSQWVIGAGVLILAALLAGFGVKKLRSGSRIGLIMILFSLCLLLQVFGYAVVLRR